MYRLGVRRRRAGCPGRRRCWWPRRLPSCPARPSSPARPPIRLSFGGGGGGRAAPQRAVTGRRHLDVIALTDVGRHLTDEAHNGSVPSGVVMGWAGWAKSRRPSHCRGPRVPGQFKKNHFPLQRKFGHLDIKHKNVLFQHSQLRFES